MTTLHSSPPNWHFTPLDLLNHGDNVKEANLFDKLTLDTLSQNVAKTILEQVNPSTTSISLLGHSLVNPP